MNLPNFLFLLGGADLEMLTIKKILTANGFAEGKDMADFQLQWGAKLSEYKKLFNETQTFVGIELVKDIEPPLHYIEIDHHNENDYKLSSLEQVIALLQRDFSIKIEMTRELQLIAANDRGYIPAMIEIGAVTEEIANIRQRDRVAQGVTEEDERLAEKSILDNRILEKGITIIKSLTDRFATITDRLFPYSRLLIYHNKELTCYGEGVSKLLSISLDLSDNSNTYTGGGPKGFWGISGKNINQELINQVIKKFAMEPFSRHIFLFPFKFKYDPKKKDENLTLKKAPLSDPFIKYLSAKWSTVDQKETTEEEAEDKVLLYNEKKYFHPFVHPVIFSDSENPNLKVLKQSSLLAKFVKKGEGWTYSIKINKGKKRNHETPILGKQREDQQRPEFETIDIDLEIRKVTLDLYKGDKDDFYKSGIGILGFHLEYYPSQSKQEDSKDDLLDNVLLINQFGRRLYPPFLDLNYKHFGLGKIDDVLKGVKHRELAESIKIATMGIDVKWEGFDHLENNLDLYDSIYLPDHILHFLDLEKKEGRFYLKKSGNEDSVNKEMEIEPVLDDRMFVMSWLGAPQLAKEFRSKALKYEDEKKKFGYVLSDLCQRKQGGFEAGGFYRNAAQQKALAINRSYDGYGYASNDFWYQYVFVDGVRKTCQNDLMQEELMDKHTYARWVENYTLFGISRYSFVMLTAPIDELRKPEINAAFLPQHLQSVYFRMVSLALVQRAMVLKFSKEINDTVDNNGKEDHEKSTKSYEQYVKFINQYYFREISTQEQGIELYDMLQEHLRVEKQAKELEKEFAELYQLINIKEAELAGKRAKIYTIFGSLFTVSLFVNGLLSSRYFKDLSDTLTYENSTWNNESCKGIYYFLILVGTGITLMFSFLDWKKDDECRFYNTKRTRSIIFLCFSVFMILAYLATFQILGSSYGIVSGITFLMYFILILSRFLPKPKDKSKDKQQNA